MEETLFLLCNILKKMESKLKLLILILLEPLEKLDNVNTILVISFTKMIQFGQ
jgi:hypothetical protein